MFLEAVAQNIWAVYIRESDGSLIWLGCYGLEEIARSYEGAEPQCE